MSHHNLGNQQKLTSSCSVVATLQPGLQFEFEITNYSPLHTKPQEVKRKAFNLITEQTKPKPTTYSLALPPCRQFLALNN